MPQKPNDACIGHHTSQVDNEFILITGVCSRVFLKYGFERRRTEKNSNKAAFLVLFCVQPTIKRNRIVTGPKNFFESPTFVL